MNAFRSASTPLYGLIHLSGTNNFGSGHIRGSTIISDMYAETNVYSVSIDSFMREMGQHTPAGIWRLQRTVGSVATLANPILSASQCLILDNTLTSCYDGHYPHALIKYSIKVRQFLCFRVCDRVIL